MSDSTTKQIQAGGIRLVVVDIDGCILPPKSEEMDFEVLVAIRHYNRLAQAQAVVPAITICSGRPQPFVELLVTLMEGNTPALFEWGAGMYVPERYESIYSQLLSDGVLKTQRNLEETIRSKLGRWGMARIQPGKQGTVTAYPGTAITISQLESSVQEILQEIDPGGSFHMLTTDTRIDLLPRGLGKGVAVKWLANYLHIPLSQIAGIGDDETDLSFLELVGFSACPANASRPVRKFVKYVSPKSFGHGVLDILSLLTQWSA